MTTEVFTNILIQAVVYDKKGQMKEALASYEEGIGLLLRFMEGISDKSKLKYFQAKVTEYFKRAEEITEFLKRKNDVGDHIHIDIKDGETNHGYKSILTNCMDPLVVFVKINDPYIRAKHQTINLLKFIETLIVGCKNLRRVELLTTTNPKESEEQITRFMKIQNNLKQSYNIDFTFEFSTTLHDRSIILSNGWHINIGRGLDYFYTCDNWSPGYFDLDLRTCRETSVDIFYKPLSDRK